MLLGQRYSLGTEAELIIDGERGRGDAGWEF